ncbi:MAG: hypothetical protein ACE5KZ_04455 [Candidatus Scalinduaceae bacterium]
MKKTIITILIPFMIYACSALKPVEKLTDKELIDKYYATDLKLYMVKREGSYNPKQRNPNEYVGTEYSSRDIDKINRLKKELEVMSQELIRRGYIP